LIVTVVNNQMHACQKGVSLIELLDSAVSWLPASTFAQFDDSLN